MGVTDIVTFYLFKRRLKEPPSLFDFSLQYGVITPGIFVVGEHRGT